MATPTPPARPHLRDMITPTPKNHTHPAPLAEAASSRHLRSTPAERLLRRYEAPEAVPTSRVV